MPPKFDEIRRKYLRKLEEHLDADVITYSANWTQAGAAGPAASINAEDVQGFMEVVHGLKRKRLALILHSPGGSPEATEAIVSYLRQKFDFITAIIPQAAMSAATMLACACNEIYMGCHSSLGPIDPQLVIQREGQMISAPAAAIEEQFRQAQEECKEDPSLLTSWIPILRQFGPALLAQCRFAEELARSLVRQWLAQYMFSDQEDSGDIAEKIANSLASHSKFKTHGRFISREQAKSIGLRIEDLETDQVLQDLVLSVFHATTITFSSTPTVKIIENSLGKAFVKSEQNVLVRQPLALPSQEPLRPREARRSKTTQSKRKKKR